MKGSIEEAVHDEGRLRAYLDGELPWADVAQLKAHLESCAECQAQIEEMRRGAIEVSGLLAMPVHTPDAYAALSTLRKAVAEEAASPNPVTAGAVQELPPALPRSQVRVGDDSRSGWTRVTRSGVGVMLAAALVLGLALFWSGLPGRIPDKLPVLGNPVSPEVVQTEQAAIATLTAEGTGHITVAVGRPAPDFTGIDVRTGEAVSLSQYRGRVVLLTFWGTWCPPCQSLLSDLHEVAVANAGVQLVNVSLGPRDDKDRVAEFLSDKNLDWPFLHVEVPGSIPYDVGTIPATYVIDAQGTIQAAIVGRMNVARSQEVARLQEAIAKAKAPIDPTPSSSEEAIANFVPPGQVRHIVVAEVNEPDIAGMFPRPESRSREIWFANGDDHLLMHFVASDDVWAVVPQDVGISSHNVGPREMWVEDDAIYLHLQGDADVQPAANVVLKYPYNADYLEMYGPDPDALTKLLTRNPEARVIESTWMDNHPVVKVVVDRSIGQPEQAPTPGVVRSSLTRTYWIDSETGQYRRAESVTRGSGPAGSMQVYTSTITIERDELLSASQVPPDLFTFKLPEGANLVERDVRLLPFGIEAGRNGWFEYIDVAGNFSVLMPHYPDWGYDSSGKTTLGADHDGVTYGVKYVTRELDLTAPGNEKNLSRAFTMSISAGKVISEQDITLGVYPGKEYRLRDNEGRYGIWRVYVAHQRVYTVFALASDETTQANTIRDFFDSFKLLNP
ncbi:MAG: redoxin domain-containing protein [Chloroflexota bacterium]|nr:redoxin domain-containing protein [Chloroflexota bacterium]